VNLRCHTSDTARPADADAATPSVAGLVNVACHVIGCRPFQSRNEGRRQRAGKATGKGGIRRPRRRKRLRGRWRLRRRRRKKRRSQESGGRCAWMT
jgi:hypothetical protein